MKTIVYGFFKPLAFCAVLFVSCDEENKIEENKPENFYRIAGEYYQLIDKSVLDDYLDDPSTGCVYAINSEEEQIPLSDNPKVKPVIVVTKPSDTPEMPNWNRQDSK